MKTSSIRRRTLVIAATAAAAAATTLVQAAPASAVTCAAGYVCIERFAGSTIVIPEGEARTFTGGITMAGIANRTKIGYCVGGNPNFGLGPGKSVTRIQTITAVGPGTHCLT